MSKEQLSRLSEQQRKIAINELQKEFLRRERLFESSGRVSPAFEAFRAQGSKNFADPAGFTRFEALSVLANLYDVLKAQTSTLSGINAWEKKQDAFLFDGKHKMTSQERKQFWRGYNSFLEKFGVVGYYRVMQTYADLWASNNGKVSDNQLAQALGLVDDTSREDDKDYVFEGDGVL